MRRRVLLASTAAAALSSATLRAQQKAMAIIGTLNANSPGPFDEKLIAAFWRGIGEIGYVVREMAGKKDDFADFES